jgi:hypothetical protein
MGHYVNCRMNKITALTLSASFGADYARAALLGQVSATNKYAWSEASGWQNLTPTAGGVTPSFCVLLKKPLQATSRR